MTLDDYLKHRRRWEMLLYGIVLTVSFCANTAVSMYDVARGGGGGDWWAPAAWEATSHVATALLIPLILLFDRRFPLTLATWRRNVPMHLAGSFGYSLLHVTLMYWARVGLFSMLGSSYRWDNWWSEFLYEYLKDFRTYAVLLALVYLYRFVLRRLRGEAGYLTQERPDEPAGDVADRFLIKKLGREFLVRVEDIDWIESAGNYVNLHVGSRVYPLRETMTGIGERLETQGFMRVHRGAIVNLDRIAEIVAFDTGDGEARLDGDHVVPVSRRFRQALRERLA